jgi:hypothetical protein
MAEEEDLPDLNFLDDREGLLDAATALLCPFCGAHATIQPRQGEYFVRCGNELYLAKDCPVSPSVYGETEEVAIRRWNTRHIPTVSGAIRDRQEKAWDRLRNGG